MSRNTDHPFQPGVKVARTVSTLGRGQYEADTVLKVYKNGNITLKSDPKQQYRVWVAGCAEPSATATGERWSRRTVRLWKDENFAEHTRKQKVIAGMRDAWDALEAVKNKMRNLRTDELSLEKVAAIAAKIEELSALCEGNSDDENGIV